MIYPVVCVVKINGSVGLCLDYRFLNSITKVDAFPMKKVDNLLATVAKAHTA